MSQVISNISPVFCWSTYQNKDVTKPIINVNSAGFKYQQTTFQNVLLYFLNGRKTISLRGRDTLSGETALVKIVLIPSEKGLTLKGKNSLQRNLKERIYSMKWGLLFRRGLVCRKGDRKSQKLSSLIVTNGGNLSRCVQSY